MQASRSRDLEKQVRLPVLGALVAIYDAPARVSVPIDRVAERETLYLNTHPSREL